MKQFTLTIDSILLYEDDIYKVTDKLNQQTLVLTRLKDSHIRYIDNSEIFSAYNKGEVEFLDEDEINLQIQKPASHDLDFTSYTEKEKTRALNKLAYIEAAEELVISSDLVTDKFHIIQITAKKIGDKSPPKSWATILRWRKLYEESGRNIISLIGQSRNRGNRTKRFDDLTENLLERAIDYYLTFERPSIRMAYKRLCLLEWQNSRKTGSSTTLPSYDAFRKRIHQIDRHLLVSKRYSKRVADMKYKAYTKGLVATRPLELTEIDHTPTDLMVVDLESRLPLGRPTLTSIIDKFSRMPVGFYFSFTPPSTLSVIECLRHAILPKVGLKNLYPALNNDWPAHGIPESIIVDNGKEFLSRDFTEITRSLGISIIRSPVKSPTYKGAVERHFRTLNDSLLKDKPGKTFSNIFDKDEYDPKKNAVISLNSLVEITHLWIVDQLNGTVNSSINTTPIRKWESGISMYPVRLPKNINIFNIALGKTLSRKIQHYGIDFESLQYNSEELSLIRRRHKASVTMKYNPNDISHIYVLDPQTNHYITVPCNDLPYAHKTLFQHQLIKKFIRKENKKIDINNLMHAEERIMEIIENERVLTKKIRRASKQARYKNVSQKTHHVQTLPNQSSDPRPLDKLSLFSDDEFDPYSIENIDNNEIAPFINENDDDLEDLYADDPEWHADYSRKDQ